MSVKKIHLPSGVWTYMVGKGSVVFFSPDGTKYVEPLDKVAGKSWDVIERGRWKHTDDAACVPSAVRVYIEVDLAARERVDS